jgi:integrase
LTKLHHFDTLSVEKLGEKGIAVPQDDVHDLYRLVKRKIKYPEPHFVYYYRLTADPLRTLRSTKKKNRAAAEAWVERHLKQPAGSEITLSEYTQDFFVWDKCPWIKRQQAMGHSFSRATSKMRRAHLDRYILPLFGKYKLTEIQAAPVFRALVDMMKKPRPKAKIPLPPQPLANQTKNHIADSFSIVMDAAVFDQLINRNPLVDMGNFADTHKKRGIPTKDEFQRLFPETAEEMVRIWGTGFKGLFWSTFVYILHVTGMRLSENRAFHWYACNWEIPAVRIIDNITADEELGATKNKERRAAFLPRRAVAMLQALREQSQFNAENDLVFPGTGGRWMAKKTPQKYFKRALAAAEIDMAGRKIVIHSLRHYYDTVLRDEISITALQFFLGHKDDRMTDRYDAADPLFKLNRFLPAREKIETIFGGKG